jgi:hypothetical protein
MSEAQRCPNCGVELPIDTPEGLCPKCLFKAGLESVNDSQAGPEPTLDSPTPSGFRPPEPAELGSQFPQLEVLELLGRGGMGAVYKARQPGLDRLVAVKILPPEAGADPAFAERFTREARAMARLSHPNIVAVHDFGRTSDGLFYFIMEYVDGVNLRQAIRSGSISPKDALAIVPQICDALQFAHDEGIVHRDIKPENVLLDKRGRVKIADFGLAKLLGHAPGDVSLTGTQQVMGTLRYMAPEQMEGTKAVDHRADIYSLGVVFYELLTGEVPVGRFAPPSKKVEIDVRLDEVVLRALEEKPEQRYQHASEVKTEVEAIRVQENMAVVLPGELEPKVLEKYRTEGKIQAIRLYRDETGAGLREAKNAVEALARRHGIVEPPIPLSKRLIAMAIAWVLVMIGVIGVLALRRLDLSPIITTTLWWGFIILLVLFNIPNIVNTYRMRGTPEGRKAFRTGGWVLVAFLGIPLAIFVLDTLSNPEPLLTYLYRELDVKPGRDDAAFIRGIFMLVVVGTLAWLIGFLVRIRSRRLRSEAERAPAAGLPAETREIDAATRSSIQRPAVAVLLVGVGASVLGASHFINWLVRILGNQPTTADPAAPLMAVAAGVMAVVGALGMMKLRSYWLAVAGGIAAMVAGSALIHPAFALPAIAVGLWAVAVLLTAKVQAAFGLPISVDRLAAAQEPRHQVRGPAFALATLSLLDCFGGSMFLWNQRHAAIAPCSLLNIGAGIAAWVVGLILLAAAIQMLRLRGYRLAFAGAILAMMPITPLFLMGIPIGLWATGVLRRAEVKAAFADPGVILSEIPRLSQENRSDNRRPNHESH